MFGFRCVIISNIAERLAHNIELCQYPLSPCCRMKYCQKRAKRAFSGFINTLVTLSCSTEGAISIDFRNGFKHIRGYPKGKMIMFNCKVFTASQNKKARFNGVLLAVAAVVTLSGCASTVGEDGISDPFEGANRAIFSFNKGIDDTVIHPVLNGYRKVVPQPARNGLVNFLRNLRSPIDFANQVLQGDIDGAGTVFVRAAINSTVGFGGLVDLAGREGIEYEKEDFGQTLAVWGVGHGPYLMVPLFGPSTARDATGYIVDILADPLRLYWDDNGHESRNNWRMAASYLVLKDKLMDVMEQLEYGAIDYYATVRSAYHQHRAAEVNDQDASMASFADIPDYDDDDF